MLYLIIPNILFFVLDWCSALYGNLFERFYNCSIYLRWFFNLFYICSTYLMGDSGTSCASCRNLVGLLWLQLSRNRIGYALLRFVDFKCRSFDLSFDVCHVSRSTFEKGQSRAWKCQILQRMIEFYQWCSVTLIDETRKLAYSLFFLHGLHKTSR